MPYTSKTSKRADSPFNNRAAEKIQRAFTDALNLTDVSKKRYIPEHTFERKRLISFKDVILFEMGLARGDMKSNIDEFFGPDKACSRTAMFKRMNLIDPKAFQDLFYHFNDFSQGMYRFDQDWHFYAIDGTESSYYEDPDDPERNTKTRGKPRGSMRTVVLYDVDNEHIVDARITDSVKVSEPEYAIQLIESNPLPDNAILTLDRYYSGFNTRAALQENGVKYIVRIKDQTSKTSFLKKAGLPQEAFDRKVIFRLSHSQTKAIKEKARKDGCIFTWLQSEIDYMKPGQSHYDLPERIVRFFNPSSSKEEEGEWISLATSLLPEEMSTEEIIKGYTSRWKEETAFLEVKHFCDMEYFHSRKKNLVEQEIWAKMLLFNIVSLFKQMAGTFKKKTLYHQLNFKQAVKHVLRFLKGVYDIKKCLVALYQETSATRHDRHNQRKSGKRKGPQPFGG